MSGSYSSDYQNDRDRRRDDDWQNEPSETILIKSVPDTVDEDFLFRWFDKEDVRIRDVRLVEKRGSRSAAFAFVEFDTVKEAAEWMNKQKGCMSVTSSFSSGVVYSRNGYDRDRGRDYDRDYDRDRYSDSRDSRSDSDESERSRDRDYSRDRSRDRDYTYRDRERTGRDRSYRDKAQFSDWKCPNPKCLFLNFSKRRECYRCTEPRPSDGNAPGYNGRRNDSRNSVDDGSSQVGPNPCNTVVLRGLDALTDERRILDSLAAITSLEPKNCYVMRNFTTGVSMGYAFMEFDSVINAVKIKDHFSENQSFEVDGKIVVVEYAKNTYSTILASIQYQQQAAMPKPTQYELQALAAKAASQMTSNIPTAAATVAMYSGAPVIAAAGASSYPQQNAEPDVSRYQYEPTSGYYYDPITGLYYDANSQYYYNSTTQQYLYWDSASKKYLPVPQNSETNKTNSNKPVKEEKKKKAKDIAKEMEKWAKSQNKKSKPNTVVVQQTQPEPEEAQRDQNTAADTAYELLLGGGRTPFTNPHKREDNKMPPSAIMALSKSSRQPPSSGEDTKRYQDNPAVRNEDSLNEANIIDRQQLTCNLCQRKFNSTAILEKHVQMSDLHKQNLAKLRQQSQGQNTAYNDRINGRDTAMYY